MIAWLVEVFLGRRHLEPFGGGEETPTPIPSRGEGGLISFRGFIRKGIQTPLPSGGVGGGYIPYHLLKRVAAMTVDDEKAAKALMSERSHDVLQDGELRFVVVVDAERQVALTGVLRTHHHRRQHHAAHAVFLQCTFGGIDGNGMREDAVGHVGQVQVMGLGGSPGQDGHIVFVLPGYSIGGDGKVDFSIHIWLLFNHKSRVRDVSTPLF